jgi:two-component system, OmpR family, copper resistance phosphate regulon response regulator CusR
MSAILEDKSSRVAKCPMQILVAEDDVALAQFLRKGLERQQYAVNVVHDGESVLRAVSDLPYDLLTLDLNLPHLDGMAVLKQLRPAKPRLPILVLTGRATLEDRIQALDTGADDCLTKPFSFVEFSARVRALLRRNTGSAGGVLRVGDLLLNREELRVERAGQRIDLTAKEFGVLEYLMLNARRPVTRAMIMENVWKAAYDPKTNLVDVYVKYVRDKVDQNFTPKLIRTVRNVGYVVADN